MKSIRTGTMILDGIILGLLAGVLFAVLEMAVADSVTAPWRAFATIFAGREALTREFSLAIFVLGLVAHFGLSLLYGGVFGVLVHILPERVARNLPALAGLGVSYGLALWILNFPIFGNLLYPWFLDMEQAPQILLHTLAFGLPLGLGMWAAGRTIHRMPQERPA